MDLDNQAEHAQQQQSAIMTGHSILQVRILL